jgi:hypothetical protein
MLYFHFEKFSKIERKKERNKCLNQKSKQKLKINKKSSCYSEIKHLNYDKSK